MEEKILEILRRVLEDNKLDQTCSQETCENWDSLRHLTICFELEGEFGIVFEPEDMEKIHSYDDIVRFIKSHK